MSLTTVQPTFPGMEGLQRREPPTTADILQKAMEAGAPIDTVERIVAMMEREREHQSRVSFDDALNACQAQIGRIAPNAKRENGIMWADYAQLDRAVRPIYVQAGFSIAFSEQETADPMQLRMRATLSKGGISKDYFAQISRAATNGKMSAQDAAASAASRVKRYLLLDIFNIAVGIDADEKKPYEAPEEITERQIAELQDYADALRQCPDLPQLKNVFADAYKFAGTVNAQEKAKMARVYEDCKRRFLK